MQKKCIVSDCSNPTRSSGSDYCEMHYYRIRRNGTTDKVRRPHVLQHSGGYVLVPAPSHPLVARHTGVMEYEHRVVYYDAHGAGPFQCYWCGKTVDWDTLHIDHLNENKQDNSVNNLVATCSVCNQKRGRHKMVITKRTTTATRIEFRGQTRTLGEWADLMEISRNAMVWRLDHGWGIERAFTEPRGKTGPMSQRERFAVINASKPIVMRPYAARAGRDHAARRG